MVITASSIALWACIHNDDDNDEGGVAQHGSHTLATSYCTGNDSLAL